MLGFGIKKLEALILFFIQIKSMQSVITLAIIIIGVQLIDNIFLKPIIYSQMDHSKNIYHLYDSSAFHDACGTGFIATLSGKPEKKFCP